MARAEFDRLFHAILSEADGGCGDRRGGSARAGADRQEAERREECIRMAVALFHRGEYARCLSLLSDLKGGAEDDPRVVAFRGACRALTGGRVRAGIECCVQALRQAFYIPDLYCALGVVLLRAGDRAKAFAAFQRGLRIDPRHPALRKRVREMGVRRRPPLRFLRRSHPANRVLGMMRARLFPA